MDVTRLSERTRKIILWSAIIALGAALFFWWGKGAAEKLERVSAPSLPESLNENIRETTESFEFPSLDLEVPSGLQEQLQGIQELNNGAREGQQ